MASTSEIKIVINVVNQAKASIDALIRDLGTVSKTLGGVGNGNSLPKVTQNLKDTADSASQLGGAFGKLVSAFKLVTGGFLAFQGVGFIKGLADSAARTEVLGVVLKQTGSNAGYTASEMRKADLAVQALGITAASSRESLTKLIQAGLSISLAAPLARASQDLAVISGWNSSDTLQRLITNIQQMDSVGLRFMGIIINQEKLMADAAAKGIDVTSEAVKKQVFANSVLAEAAKLQGIYENSLQSAAKALTSMPRHIEALKVSLGNQLLPIYTELIKGTTEIIKVLVEAAQSFESTSPNAKYFADSIGNTGEKATDAANGVKYLMGVLKSFVELLIKYKTELAAVAVGLGLAFGGSLLLSGLAALYKSIMGIGYVLGLLAGAIVNLLPIIRAMTVALTLLTLSNPITAAIAAIAAVVTTAAAAWYLFSGSTDAAGDALDKSGKKIQTMDSLIQQLADQMLRKNRLEQEAIDLQGKLAEANNKMIGKKGAERAVSQAEVDALSKQIKAKQKELDKVLDDLGATRAGINKLPEATAEQGKNIERIEKIGAQPAADAQAVREAGEALADALRNAGIDTGTWSSGVATKFKAEVKGMADAIKSIQGPGKLAEIQLEAVLDRFIEIASKARTDEDLSEVENVGFQLALKARALGKNFDETYEKALAQAAKNVKKANSEKAAGGAAALQEANAFSKALADAAENRVKNEVALIKISNDQKATQEKQAYDRGELFFEEYYATRRRIIEENTAIEIRLSEAAIKKLEVSRRLATTNSERVSLKNQIDQERAKQVQIRAKGAVDTTASFDEQKQEADAILEKVRSLRQEIGALTGNDAAAAIDRVNQKYDAMLKARAMTKDQTDAIEQLRLLEVATVTLDKQNEKLSKEIALRTALVNLRQAEVAYGAKKGLLTEIEALELNNQAILQQIGFNKETIKLEEAKLALYEKQGNKQAARESETRIASLQTQTVQLAATYETLGDRIQKTFTDSLATGIEGVINKTKTLKQAAESVLSDVAATITKISAKDLAEKSTRFLIENTSVGGKSPFDFLGDLFKGAPGSSITNPMYAQIVGGLGGGVVPFGPTQDGGNLAGTTGAAAGGQGTFMDKVLGFFGIGQKKTDEVAKKAADGVLEPLGNAIEGSAQEVSASVSGGSIFDAISGIFKSLEGLFESGPEQLSGPGMGGGGGGFMDLLGQAGGWISNLFAEDGGLLVGASHLGGGIQLEAEGGEYIVNKDSTQKWLPFLQMINSRGSIPPMMPRTKYADGGVVVPPSAVGAGRSQRVTVVQNITTPDVVGFRKSRDQIAAESGAAVNRAMRRNR